MWFRLTPGGTIASILSYTTEKRLSKHPEEFGQGAIEGVAGPEAANNSDTAGAMVPLLSLGIPGGGATAVLHGWRASTIDVDLKLVPDDDALLRALPRLKEELHVNLEADDRLVVLERGLVRNQGRHNSAGHSWGAPSINSCPVRSRSAFSSAAPTR